MFDCHAIARHTRSKIIGLVCVCVLGTVGSLCAEEFRDVAGNFKVVFPSDRRCEVTKEEVRVGVETLTSRVYSVQRKHAAYLLTYVDYPASIKKEREPESLLSTAGSAAVTRMNGVRVKTEKVTQPAAGHHITFKGKAKDGVYRGHLRQMIVRGRLYQLLVVGQDGELDDTEIKAFFESFEISRQ